MTTGLLEFVAKIDDQATSAASSLESVMRDLGGPIDPITGELDVDADDALSNLDDADGAVTDFDGSEAEALADADVAAAEAAMDQAEAAVDAVDGSTATAIADADTTPATEELGALPAETETIAEDAGGRFHEGFLKAAAVAALAASVVAGFQQLYEVGSVFDNVTDTIRVGTGAQGDALEGLTGIVDNLGTRVPANFETIGGTVADLNTRLGLSGDTLEGVAEQYLWAGQILGEDVDINATSAAFSAFQIEGDGVSAAMDHLFRVSQATGVGMNELANSATQSAPAMSMLGFSFEETTALAGQLDKQGLNATQMMSGMSRSLVNLAKDGEEPAEAFERTVGEMEGFIESGDRAAAIDLAGKVFGTRGASQFVGAIESGALALDDIVGSAGLTEDTIVGLGEETSDFAESWQLVKNGAQQALEPIGSAVFDTLGSSLSAVMPYLESFGTWASENPTAVRNIAIALGVFATALGIAAAAQWVMNSALLASPITWIVVGVAALIAAFVLLMMNLETVRAWLQGVFAGVAEWFKGVWDSIAAKVGEVWTAIVGWITTKLAEAQAVLMAVLSAIGAWWSETWAGIKAVVTAVWTAIVGWITDRINSIKATIAAVMAGIKAAWSAVWNAIKAVASAVWGAIKTAVSNYINGIKSTISTVLGAIKGVWSGAWNAVKSAASTVWSGIKSVVSGAISNVKANVQKVRDVIAVVRNAFNDAKTGAQEKLRQLVDFVRDIPGRILRALGSLGNLLLGAGRAVIQGFLDGITGAFDRVRNKLGELTDMLPDWKGPADVDREILRGSGHLVIGGFIEGLEDRYSDAERSLGRFTDGLGADVDLGPDLTAAGLPGRSTVTVRTEMAPADRRLMSDFLRYARAMSGRPITVPVSIGRRQLAEATTEALQYGARR